MRKSFFTLVVGALGMFSVLTTNAQKSKSFAGTVKFSVKYEGFTNPQLHIPREVVYTIFGNKIKLQETGATVIFNGDAVIQTVLIDMPGNKFGFELSKEYFEELQSANKYTYKKGDETKTICGYVCTRYDVKIYNTEEDEETKAVVYTTTEIGENSDINAFEYPGLTGFSLYTEKEEKGVKTILEAFEVKPTKVKAVDFLVPANYKMMSPSEVGSYYQGLIGGKE